MALKWDDVITKVAGRFVPASTFEDVEKFVLDNDNFILAGQPEAASHFSIDLKTNYNKNVECFVAMGSQCSSSAYDMVEADAERIAWRKGKTIIASYHAFEVAQILISQYGLSYLDDFVCFDHVYLLSNPLFHDSAGARFYDYFINHSNDFGKTFGLLSDELSQITYMKLINYRLKAFNPELMSIEDLPTPIEIQYGYEKNATTFLDLIPAEMDPGLKNGLAFKLSLDAYSYLDIVSPQDKQVIFNIGAYNNSSTPLALSTNKGCVYAFEPQADKHKDNLAQSKIFPGIIPIQKGVWKESTSLSFKIDKSATGGSTASYISDEGSTTIEVISIDEFAHANNVAPDFIKMDTEGAELEVIEGGMRTIEKYLPDLAISIYHHPSHLHLIPDLVKKISKRYQIFIGHKYFDFMETVLFAKAI